jgi:hypothetical protein
MGVSRPRAPLGARYACICICRWIHASAAGYMPGCLGSHFFGVISGQGNSQLSATSGPNQEPRSPNIKLIGCQSVRDSVELPFAADCCPCVEKLRTVLPFTVGISDGAVHLVSTFGSSGVSLVSLEGGGWLVSYMQDVRKPRGLPPMEPVVQCALARPPLSPPPPYRWGPHAPLHMPNLL